MSLVQLLNVAQTLVVKYGSHPYSEFDSMFVPVEETSSEATPDPETWGESAEAQKGVETLMQMANRADGT